MLLMGCNIVMLVSEVIKETFEIKKLSVWNSNLPASNCAVK